jgi:hypothetical protein
MTTDKQTEKPWTAKDWFNVVAAYVAAAVVGCLLSACIALAMTLAKPLPPRHPAVQPLGADGMLSGLAAGFAPETSQTARLAEQLGGEAEYRLFDGTRVDILTPTEAIEVDWPEKWAEAIGQAVYYGEMTGRKPVALLLLYDQQQHKYVYRAMLAGMRAGVTVRVEYPPVTLPPATKDP